MSSSLPTVVLVHGAWHIPYHYQRYVSALEQRGFTVHCPHLPSSNGASPPNASLPEDARCVRELVESLVNVGERVLMIMHSYGGMVGTDAVDGLTLSERQAKSQPGGVIHLLYLCAYMLPPGSSLFGVVEELGFAPLWPQLMDDAPDGTTFPKDPTRHFYGDIDKEIVDHELVPRLKKLPLAVLHAKSTGSAWKAAPVTYVSTQQDNACPRLFQDMMVGKVRDSGVIVQTEDYNTAHSPFITMTAEMVETAVRAAEDERNSK